MGEEREGEREIERGRETERDREGVRERGRILCVDWASLEDHRLKARQTDEILDFVIGPVGQTWDT